MATPHGRKAVAIKTALLERPERFSLIQALHLLTLELEAEGLSSAEAARCVRIVPWLSLAYPPGEVTALRVTPKPPAAARVAWDKLAGHSVGLADGGSINAQEFILRLIERGWRVERQGTALILTNGQQTMRPRPVSDSAKAILDYLREADRTGGLTMPPQFGDYGDSAFGAPAVDDLEVFSERYTLESPLMGLYSTQGPLPTLYTEELLDEARADQSVVKDFLDIINNRLAHYFCRAELHYDYPRRLIEFADADVELVLNSLIGQAYPELRPARHPHPQAAELLIGPRTAQGLAAYLAFELGWPAIEVEECVLRSAPIPPAQRCRLGLRNTRLGEVFVGERIDDCMGKIRIHLKELPEADLQNYLFGAPGHAALLTLVRCYMDEALVFDIKLHPADRILENHTLGGHLRVGCHLAPKGVAPRLPVTVYSRSPKQTPAESRETLSPRQAHEILQ
ncbi:MAG: type VI secretion system baseplate subunit TssG [Candidatus Accumulibacter sp.]|jgi:type VI secretion system protein ImpH|nr:type VI secretion system baseplate subunit TssG [Accumulibacter sp.]